MKISRTCVTILRLTLLLAVMPFAGVKSAMAQQRYQAMSLHLLTELPERDAKGSAVASKQLPNKVALKIADEARISPPFAFHRTDEYVAPDFESFFPDDRAGGNRMIYSVKAYRGFLDRPIERLGIEPAVLIHHTADFIAQGEDEVLTAARNYLAGKLE